MRKNPFPGKIRTFVPQIESLDHGSVYSIFYIDVLNHKYRMSHGNQCSIFYVDVLNHKYRMSHGSVYSI